MGKEGSCTLGVGVVLTRVDCNWERVGREKGRVQRIAPGRGAMNWNLGSWIGDGRWPVGRTPGPGEHQE